MNRSHKKKLFTQTSKEVNTISEHAEKGFTEFACQQLVKVELEV